MLAPGPCRRRALSLSRDAMVSVIPASQVSIALLEERYGLREATQPDFFSEWTQGLGQYRSVKLTIERNRNS